MGCLFTTTKNAESNKYKQSTCHITKCGTKSRNSINVNCAGKENYRPTSTMNKDKKVKNNESDDDLKT